MHSTLTVRKDWLDTEEEAVSPLPILPQHIGIVCSVNFNVRGKL
jgi:hypothetical protein